MSKREDNVTAGMRAFVRIGIIAGFLALCLVACVVPMAFGEPFGWYGRLWVGVVAIIYFPLALGLWYALTHDRKVDVWELVRRAEGDDAREPSREERREYRGRH